MSKVLVGQSLRLISVFKKYNIAISAKERMDWSLLKGKMIGKVDIDRLIYVVGIIGNRRIINPTDTHWRDTRYYKCSHCNDFKLYFEKVKDESNAKKETYVLCQRFCVMKHHDECCIKKMY
jgi:hypothetical protein